jgi:hypothetical protein
MNPINAQFMRDHFTLVTITDKPARPIDPDILAEILAAMDSATARLRGPQCTLSNQRAAHALERAAADLREALEN